MKTTISISDDVFRSADQFAKQLSMSRSELYTIAIREFLEKHKTDGVTQLINRVYHNVEQSRLDPFFADLQEASIQKDERLSSFGFWAGYIRPTFLGW